MRITGSSERAHRSALLCYVLRPWIAFHPTKSLLFLALFLPITLSPSGALAVEWYVDAAAAPGGDGSSWEKAFSGIQEAADTATDGDTIIVAPGVYSQDKQLAILADIVLRSKDPADRATVDRTVISETYTHLCNGTITGFTICGGALTAREGAVAITHNVIRDGGGVAVHGASPLISGNLILGNSGLAGGIIITEWASPVIVNNIIVGNAGGLYGDRYGGGISCGPECSPLIANNTIVGNSAGLYGGGHLCIGRVVAHNNELHYLE